MPRAAREVSLDPLQERRRFDVECVGEADDGAEPGIATGAFEEGHLSAVEAAGMAEGFLREATSLTLLTEVARELLPGLHRRHGRRRQTKPLQTKPLVRVIVTPCPAGSSCCVATRMT
jgi:hypothetical protein